MISKLTIKSGFAEKLPLFSRQLTFTPGLNILFGPNGCGKTTALKIMGAYSSIKGGGWSGPPEPGDVRGLDGRVSKSPKFPDCFKKISPGGCSAEMEWDGSPSYLDTSAGEDVMPAYFADNAADMKEQLNVMFSKPSSGQLRLHKIGRMVENLTAQNVPQLDVYKDRGMNDVWEGVAKEFAAYVATLQCKKVITLLMDEPDRSLSIPLQSDLWLKAMPQWSTRAQVIVATHSPFALISPGANIIECVSGYVADCRQAFKGAFTSLK